MKAINKLISVIICAVLLTTSIPFTAELLVNNASANISDTSVEAMIFYKYIKNSEIEIINPVSFPTDYKDSGKISALIDDINSDGKKEMLLFGLHGITLYGVYNGKVSTPPDSSAITFNYGLDRLSGNGSSHVCAEYKNKTVYLYLSSIGYGGSYSDGQYVSFFVSKDNEIYIISNYIYSYRRGAEKWDAAGYKSFPQNEDYFQSELIKAGFSRTAHYHNDYFMGDYSAQSFEGFRGNHIFSMYISNWDYAPGVISGHLYDNTKLKENTEKSSQAVSRGDIDCDSKITAADARLALRASVGLEKFSETQTLAADVDNNKSVTAADARTILRVSVGLEKL